MNKYFLFEFTILYWALGVSLEFNPDYKSQWAFCISFGPISIFLGNLGNIV